MFGALYSRPSTADSPLDATDVLNLERAVTIVGTATTSSSSQQYTHAPRGCRGGL